MEIEIVNKQKPVSASIQAAKPRLTYQWSLRNCDRIVPISAELSKCPFGVIETAVDVECGEGGGRPQYGKQVNQSNSLSLFIHVHKPVESLLKHCYPSAHPPARLSVCSHETNREPSNVFSLNFVFIVCTRICWDIPVLVIFMTKVAGTLHEEIRTFLWLSSAQFVNDLPRGKRNTFYI
jgi:hypothetical protein